MTKRDVVYQYWLCNVPQIGNAAIGKMLDICESAEEIYHTKEECWKEILTLKQRESLMQSKKNWKLWEEYEKLEKSGILFVTWQQQEYPERLRKIPDAPYGLFCMGNLPGEDALTVAVIGARECSEYGNYVAKGLGKLLGEQGIPVISGMARGVDSISQMAALEAGGISYGVLGSGVDICYPAANRSLYEKLKERGGVLSMLPPGTMPRPQYFPPRNRIVSGLADVIVVVEARNKSGTLITVDMALEQGRDVYVVPGRITDRLSDGCNKLIKQGAGVVLSPMDFLEEMRERGLLCQEIKTSREMQNEIKENAEKESSAITLMTETVYGALDMYPRSLDEILSKLPGNVKPMEVNKILLKLCMMQRAKQLSPGHFCLNSSSMK